jgi:methylthioribose-1-phosphate isomerase
LLQNGDAILTHCNAGRLAAVKYGTATAPLYLGAERGMTFKIYADETRPLLQGARLTAFELKAAGFDVTLICDNLAASVLQRGLIKAVLLGCDRVAANGDTANKIGTLPLAIVARRYGTPVYFCAPTSSIDLSCACGREIVIEQREGSEITDMWYAEPMAPAGCASYNPAVDVTEHELITAFVTECGLAYPPFTRSLKAIFRAREEGKWKL